MAELRNKNKGNLILIKTSAISQFFTGYAITNGAIFASQPAKLNRSGIPLI
jgi:hypothetical protein